MASLQMPAAQADRGARLRSAHRRYPWLRFRPTSNSLSDTARTSDDRDATTLRTGDGRKIDALLAGAGDNDRLVGLAPRHGPSARLERLRLLVAQILAAILSSPRVALAAAIAHAAGYRRSSRAAAVTELNWGKSPRRRDHAPRGAVGGRPISTRPGETPGFFNTYGTFGAWHEICGT